MKLNKICKWGADIWTQQALNSVSTCLIETEAPLCCPTMSPHHVTPPCRPTMLPHHVAPPCHPTMLDSVNMCLVLYRWLVVLVLTGDCVRSRQSTTALWCMNAKRVLSVSLFTSTLNPFVFTPKLAVSNVDKV